MSNQDNLEIIEDLKSQLVKNEKIIDEYKSEVELHKTELNYKNSQINGFDLKLDVKDSKIKDLESKLINRENEINHLNNQIFSLRNEISYIQENHIKKESMLNDQITSLKNESMFDKEDFENKKNEFCNQIDHLKTNINQKDKEFNYKNNLLKNQNTQLLSKLDTKEYCISCYKKEINNNHLEIEFLKENSLIKKIFAPLAYLYLIFKSDFKEISLNFKLYKLLKNSNCFDIGFYLNNNKDLIGSKWCKYFSPELHYLCNGFKEKRKFNNKYFNTNSKEELLDYILKCNY